MRHVCNNCPLQPGDVCDNCPPQPGAAHPHSCRGGGVKQRKGEQPAEKAEGEVTDNSVTDAVTLITFKTLNQNTT